MSKNKATHFDTQACLFNQYNNISTSNSRTRTLYEIHRGITGQKFAAQTESHRVLLEKGRTKEAQQTKNMLPAFAPAVRFQLTGGHSSSNIQEYTGLAMLDFDHFPSPQAKEEAARRAREDSHVVMVYSSVSNLGLHVYVGVQLDERRPEESYAEYYAFLCDYFETLLGHPADRKCKDPTRLSFINYDPDAYLNQQADLFTPADLADARDVAATASETREEDAESELQATKRRGRPRVKRDVERCGNQVLRQLERSGVYFAPHSHNEFLSDFAYSMNRFGVLEEETAQWLTEHYADQAPEYDAREIARICRSAYRSAQHEFRTQTPHYMKHTADAPKAGRDASATSTAAPTPSPRGGKRGKGQKLTTREEIYRAVLAYADVRYNEFKQLVEVRMHDAAFYTEEELAMRRRLLPAPKAGADGYVPLSEEILDSLAIHLERLDPRITTKRIAETLISHLPPKYDPLLNYYDALPRWDGRDRTQDLFRVFHLKYVEGDDELRTMLQSVMHRFLVGMVAGSLTRGYNELIWGVFGPEAYGKTRFFHNLLPEPLQHLCAEINKSSLADKDTRIAMSENVMLLLDECSGMDADWHTLMNDYATKDGVQERRPYMRAAVLLMRRCSWVATGNKPDIVRLSSGSRRWLMFHLDAPIDEALLAQIDKDQLFAQLLHEATHEDEFPRFLSTEEAHALSRYNILHCDPREMKLLKERYYLILNGEDLNREGAAWYTATQIFTSLSMRNTFQLDLDLLEEVLRVLDVATITDDTGVQYYRLAERPMPHAAGGRYGGR